MRKDILNLTSKKKVVCIVQNCNRQEWVMKKRKKKLPQVLSKPSKAKSEEGYPQIDPRWATRVVSEL